jgi:hypothetical protein
MSKREKWFESVTSAKVDCFVAWYKINVNLSRMNQ